MMTNVVGTNNLLHLAEAAGARFLLTSTSEVYGDPDIHPQAEDYRGNVNCTGPRACYDEGKRAAEALTFDYARLGRVEVRVEPAQRPRAAGGGLGAPLRCDADRRGRRRGAGPPVCP